MAQDIASNAEVVDERADIVSSLEINFATIDLAKDVPNHLRPLLVGEQRALSFLIARKAIDLSTNDLAQDDPASAGQWDEQRQLRGQFLTWLIAESPLCNDLSARRLRIIGARINGVLDLSFRRVGAYLYFSQCSISSGIRFTSARLFGLEFAQVHSGPISGWAAVSEGPIIFELSRISGQLNIPSSKIAGDFILRNSKVDADGGLAVNAANFVVEGNFSLLNSRVLGYLALFNATIKGLFEIDGGQILSSFSSAISGDGINISGRCLVRNSIDIKGTVRLVNAKIGGEFNFSGARIVQEGEFALDARGAKIGGSLLMVNGFHSVGKLAFYGAEIGGECNFWGAHVVSSSDVALDLRNVSIRGAVNLGGGFAATGAVLLYNAAVNGDLFFSGAQLSVKKGPALDARRCRIEGGVFFGDGFSADEEISFYGAFVGGELVFAKAVVRAANVAVQLSNSRIARFSMDESTIKGSIKLVSAQVGSDIGFFKSKITSRHECAIEGDNLRSRSLSIRDGTIIEGMIRLYGAGFDGDIVLAESHLKRGAKEHSTIFFAATMRCEGTLHWLLATPPEGIVNLEQAHVDGLSDRIEGWPHNMRLDGFTYSRLLGDATKAAAVRLDWLSRQDRYYSQPFEHLLSIYRGMGDSSSVAEVALSKWRTRRREMYSWRLDRIWDIFLDVSSGYGYRPWRPLVGLILVLSLGSIVFWWGEKRGAFCAIDTVRAEKPCVTPPQYPKFNPVIYSIESMLPVGELGQRRFYVIRGDMKIGNYLGLYVGLHRFLGIVFSLLLALAPTNILRRE